MINQPSLYNNINFLGYKTNFSKQLEKFNAEPCPTPEEMIELKKSMSKIIKESVKLDILTNNLHSSNNMDYTNKIIQP